MGTTPVKYQLGGNRPVILSSEGKRLTGDAAYRSIGTAIAPEVDRDRRGRSVLFLPIGSGGRSFGEPVEEGFAELGIPYTTLPIRVSKLIKRVIEPSYAQIQAYVESLRNSNSAGVMALAHEDTTRGGSDLLATFDFLMKYQERFGDSIASKFDDIRLSAVIDAKGIADYYWMPMAKERVDKHAALEEFRKSRYPVLASLVQTLFDSLTRIRRPRTESILKRNLML